MPHHLLSFLGTSDYKECTYFHEAFSFQTSYSSQAIAHYILLQDSATEGLKTTLFVTHTAAQKNREKLKQKWDSCTPLHFSEIPEGGGEDSYWAIFEAINQAVADTDSVWLDITHSFRYLPMLAYAVLQYLQDVRGIQVKGIYYGAAEVLGPPKEWPTDPSECRIPLHNLTPFIQVNQWAGALRTLKHSGAANQIRKLTDNKALPLIKQSKGKDTQAKALKQLGIALETWSLQIATCRGKDLIDSVIGERIDDFIQVIGTQMVPPLAHQFEQLKEQFSKVRKGRVQNIFIAAEWCASRGLSQQTWTLLQEGLITYFTLLWRDQLEQVFPVENKSPDIKKKVFVQRRELVAQVFTVSAYNIPIKQWKAPLCKYSGIGQALQDALHTDLAQRFAEISADRNDINHAGFDQNAADHKKIAQRAQQKILDVKALLPEAFKHTDNQS